MMSVKKQKQNPCTHMCTSHTSVGIYRIISLDTPVCGSICSNSWFSRKYFDLLKVDTKLIKSQDLSDIKQKLMQFKIEI